MHRCHHVTATSCCGGRKLRVEATRCAHEEAEVRLEVLLRMYERVEMRANDAGVQPPLLQQEGVVVVTLLSIGSSGASYSDDFVGSPPPPLLWRRFQRRRPAASTGGIPAVGWW
eukprot:GHVU01165857.1.p1 GENE.GHVU01165857.1~~GHVU01165857.1.p1  ORF type:complete len:114 (-),score=17.76 GHVU01165857.1:294-635(-)